jgi:hypothetical protein
MTPTTNLICRGGWILSTRAVRAVPRVPRRSTGVTDKSARKSVPVSGQKRTISPCPSSITAPRGNSRPSGRVPSTRATMKPTASPGVFGGLSLGIMRTTPKSPHTPCLGARSTSIIMPANTSSMRTLELGPDWSTTKGRGAMGSHACAYLCIAEIAETMAITRTSRLWSHIREVRCKDICSLHLVACLHRGWSAENRDLRGRLREQCTNSRESSRSFARFEVRCNSVIPRRSGATLDSNPNSRA